ncbi:MAG: PDZ domain-containing protein [Vicinamibacterales bacterium]
MRGLRPLSIVTFVIAVSALVGGLFGRSALAVDDRVAERYATFATALSAIESQYVDKVESDRVVYSAIRGMLSTLDPHSSFFDPREYTQMRERQEGRYYGLGITIQSIDGDITAASVFEGSPAYKTGIRRGDVMARIDGESAKGWTTEQAMKKLRGQRGTVVKVEIRRRGYDDLIPLDVTRDEVQILTVPAHFMIDATTGYVRHPGLGREHRPRDAARAEQSPLAGDEAAAVKRHPRQPWRTARSGHQGVERVPAEGEDDRLHARPRAELRSGLSRDGRQQLPRYPDGRPRESQQRERVGVFHRRHAGPRSPARRRRDDLRQGARAVGLSNQQRRRPRADDSALLHAERSTRCCSVSIVFP